MEEVEKLEDVSHWTIESTRAVTKPKGTTDETYTYNQNHSTEVVAASVHRALEMFTAVYPQDVVHVVRKTSRLRTVLIDRQTA